MEKGAPPQMSNLVSHQTIEMKWEETPRVYCTREPYVVGRNLQDKTDQPRPRRAHFPRRLGGSSVESEQMEANVAT